MIPAGNATIAIPKIEERNGEKMAFTYYPTVNEYLGNRNLQIIVQNYR